MVMLFLKFGFISFFKIHVSASIWEHHLIAQQLGKSPTRFVRCLRIKLRSLEEGIFNDLFFKGLFTIHDLSTKFWTKSIFFGKKTD